MKYFLITSLILCTPLLAFNQVLLETIDGDEITLNPTGITNSSLFGNLNSSEQSLQFKTLFILPSKRVTPSSFFTLGLKGKPSDGIFTLFSGGNFNPSTNINLSFTHINLFSDAENANLSFTDFFSIKAEYSVNKLTLFNPDSIFNKQIDNINFVGGGITFNYNALLSGRNLFTLSTGYLQNNNYGMLKSIDIRDFQTITDSITGTSRQYGKVVSGKLGDYKEFESFPLRFAYTYCPSEESADSAKVKLGFSIYYSGEFGKFIPSHNIGTLFFLTKQNEKSGVRVPIIGLGIQANDITDNLNSGNAVTKRITFNLTTTFNLTGL